MIVGHVEESGLLPGWIKLAGDGLNPYSLVMFGEEKSSISLLRTMPVSVTTPDPKYPFTVLQYNKEMKYRPVRK